MQDAVRIASRDVVVTIAGANLDIDLEVSRPVRERGEHLTEPLRRLLDVHALAVLIEFNARNFRCES